MNTTDKLAEALRKAIETLEGLQGGCTDSNDGTVEALTVWCPDVIDELRATLAAYEAEAKPAESVALSPMARRRVFDAIRAAYDLGHSDRQNGSYAGREVEVDHGGALISGLQSIAYLEPPAPAAPAPWVEVTTALLAEQHDWLYKPMWIALKDGRVTTGVYEWRQGRGPDRLIGPEIGDEWAFNASHVMPIVPPAPPEASIGKGGAA